MPDIVQIPIHGFSAHVAPLGHLYWFNHFTGKATYEDPLAADTPLVLPPLMELQVNTPQINPVQVNPLQVNTPQPIQPQSIPQIKYIIPKPEPVEIPVRKYRLPETSLFVVLTNFGNDFLYDADQKLSTWDPPEDYRSVVDEFRSLLNESTTMSPTKRKAEQMDETVIEDEQSDRIKKLKQQQPVTDSAMEEDFEWQLAHMDQQISEKFDLEQTQHINSGDAQEVNAQSTIDPIDSFKELLDEHKVSPFDTWETIAPKILDDPRYQGVLGDKERKAAFDSYCTIKAAEIRVAKKDTTPRSLIDKLFAEHVTIKTRWDDFKRKHKRDARFYGFGKNDKEREQAFKEYLDTLRRTKKGEEKQVKENFIALLSESEVTYTLKWQNLKEKIENDKRFKSITLPGECERLFNEYIQTLNPMTHEEKNIARKRREEEALRERKRQIRHEQSQVNREINKGRQHLQHEEAVNTYRAMLVDYIKQPTQLAQDYLTQDSRYGFVRCYLSEYEQSTLFKEHTQAIFALQLSAFHTLLEETVPTLTTVTVSWRNVRALVVYDPRSVRLEKSDTELESLFNNWVTQKTSEAQQEFDLYLRSSAFLKYWTSQSVASSLTTTKASDNIETDNITEMRAGHLMTYNDIEQVLQNDVRWKRLNHVPNERCLMVNDFLATLQAEKVLEKQRGFRTVHHE